MPSLHVIYASTSGHTEFVVDTLIDELKNTAPQMWASKQRVELAKPEDMEKGDVLILASSTWNTGSIEGQLNPHMHAYLKERAAGIDLKGKKVGLIGLGDDRYHFTVGALTHLEEFVKTHNGQMLEPVLRIVNEPYDQQDTVKQWTKEFLSSLEASS